MNTHAIVAEIRRDMSRVREDPGSQNRVVRYVYFYRTLTHAYRCLDSE